jgi:inner membrane protein
MDNVTHSLIGLTAGECLFSLTQKISLNRRPALSRKSILILSVVAANFPDLDVLIGKFSSSPFDSLLQHRGYTHTLVGALIQALFFTLTLMLVSKVKKRRDHFKTISWIFTVGFIGIFLHILLDSLNSYGVHPFWPFNNKWYYGDSIFIIEPWIWATLSVLLFSVYERGLARWSLLLLSFFSLGISIYFRIAPIFLIVMLLIWMIGLFFLSHRFSIKKRPWIAAIGFSLVTLFFVFSGRFVKSQLREIQWQLNPEGKRFDVILNPMPLNFFCWSFIFVEVQGKPSQYKLTSGFFSLAPEKIRPQTCSNVTQRNQIVSFTSQHAGQDPRIVTYPSYKVPVDSIIQFYKNDCRVRTYFQFSRAPFVQSKNGKLEMGDYRFEKPKVEGFSRLKFPLKPIDCPSHSVPWLSPREDFIHYMTNYQR